MSASPFAQLSGREVRALCRAGTFDQPTAGVAWGYVQANLVILRDDVAADFETFCRANPKPCPLLEVTEPGRFEAVSLAPGSDLRTDLPRYRLYRGGKCVATPTDVKAMWEEVFVAFLIGCSFTFDRALREAGVPLRHIEQGCNIPMYRTNIACASVGRFTGPLVVSMRPMTEAQAEEACRVCASRPEAHGEPVHIGAPQSLGIDALERPDYGEPVTLRRDEVPVFWACGVTPLEAIRNAKPQVAITHQPGHMFVTDILDKPLGEDSLTKGKGDP